MSVKYYDNFCAFGNAENVYEKVFFFNPPRNFINPYWHSMPFQCQFFLLVMNAVRFQYTYDDSNADLLWCWHHPSTMKGKRCHWNFKWGLVQNLSVDPDCVKCDFTKNEAFWFRFLVLTTSLLPPPPLDVEKGKNIWKYLNLYFMTTTFQILLKQY